MIRLGECWTIILASMIVFSLIYVFSPILAVLPGLFILFTLFFFRDPERIIPGREGVLVSPADGTVLDVEEFEDEFVGKSMRLSIFMSAFNVHVNRAPMDAKVASVRHTPGRKVTAYKKGDLTVRERNRIEFEGTFRIAVEQYAGIFARRIVCFINEGDIVSKGGRIGMIKYGSRVDVLMPLNVKVIVSKGDNLTAGESMIGVIDE
ncbi:MAG: phosphatidylserine decarboxylase [Candidatus Altiarchaeota archaeon]